MMAGAGGVGGAPSRKAAQAAQDLAELDGEIKDARKALAQEETAYADTGDPDGLAMLDASRDNVRALEDVRGRMVREIAPTDAISPAVGAEEVASTPKPTSFTRGNPIVELEYGEPVDLGELYHGTKQPFRESVDRV